MLPSRVVALMLALGAPATDARGDDRLPELFARARPAVVAVGTVQPLRAPGFEFRGTGFVVDDGLTVATNAHVVPAVLDVERRESLAIAVPGPDGGLQVREARLMRDSPDTDLALLRLEGARLPALPLAARDALREGDGIAIIGYPLGSVLGLHPAIHRGIVAAVTPLSLPTRQARQLDPRGIARLRQGPPSLYQLDATAHPGHSGSPVLDPRNGSVVGILNAVLVRTGKESVLPQPSGISYAVPVHHLVDLMNTSR